MTWDFHIDLDATILGLIIILLLFLLCGLFWMMRRLNRKVEKLLDDISDAVKHVASRESEGDEWKDKN